MQLVRFPRFPIVLTCVTSLYGLTGCRTSADAKDPAVSKSAVEKGATGKAADKTDGKSDGKTVVGNNPGKAGAGTALAPMAGHSIAAFAAGCFWGVEDGFRKVPGVTATAVGYTGGRTSNPTYEAVCDHGTGHAETVLVEFDPAKVSYDKLLVIFFALHDATQLDRQGPDHGDQYRSAIFTWSSEQEKAAKAAIAKENVAKGGKVVTRLTALSAFWKAEEYHQQYSERTGHHGCPTGKIDDLL